MDSGAPTNAFPVIVTPVPARQSRTLLCSKIAVGVGVIAGLIPELIDLFADPTIIAAMNRFLPEKFREGFIALGLPALGVIFHRLRKVTAGPIAGTPLATELAESADAMHLMSTKRR